MIYNLGMKSDGIKFDEWLSAEFDKWNKQYGGEKKYAAFAKYLGVPATSLSNWINGGYAPGRENLAMLAEKLGPDIYRILGMDNVPGEPTSYDELPSSIRSRLDAAASEVEATLRKRGITGESPEAERITIEIFERYGFKYTHTEYKPSGDVASK
jgi:hypothetical protein